MGEKRIKEVEKLRLLCLKILQYVAQGVVMKIVKLDSKSI